MRYIILIQSMICFALSLIISLPVYSQAASASDVGRAFGAAPDPVISMKQTININQTPTYDPYLAEEIYRRRQARAQAKKAQKDYSNSILKANDLEFLLGKSYEQADSFLSIKKYVYYKNEKDKDFESFTFAYKTNSADVTGASYVTLRYEDSSMTVYYQETNKSIIDGIRDEFVKSGYQYAQTVNVNNAMLAYYLNGNYSFVLKTSVDANNKAFYVANLRFDL